MGVIYKITSPSGKLYVGKTYDLRKRINAYKCDIKKGRKDIKLHNSLRKYGWDAHVLEVIEEINDELLNEREIYWIAELKTYCYEYPDGLNMTKGGEGQRSTWMHKTELRQWFSERFTGDGNPFYGKHHSEEFKKRKSKEVSEYNKKNGIKIPKWGVEKSRLKKIKPVLMYDATGKFVREFESCTEASNFVGGKPGDVSVCANEKRSHSRGYVFRYKTENYPLQIEVELKQQGAKRSVVGMYAGEVVEFDSSLEAAEYYNIPKTTINRAAMYNQGKPIRTGHQFYYKDLLNQQNRPCITGPWA